MTVSLLSWVKALQERVIITKHSRPAAVLMSVDNLDSMEETICWQSQPGVHDDIDAAREEAPAGHLYEEEAVRRRYGVRISK